jgi:hypothetical protein
MTDQLSYTGNSFTPELSQAQGDISVANQGLSFVQGLDQLLGNPLSRTFQSWNYKAEKKALLGEWHDFLYDSKADVYYVPALEKAPFWQYLVRANGILRPQGTCEATADWARLLYGLGIGPKTGIVSKALRTPRTTENHMSDIALELDGEVMCHIVNLYETDPPTNGVTVKELRSATKWSTQLGSFRLLEGSNSSQIRAIEYRPGSERSLAAVKRPFWPISGDIGLLNPQHLDRLLTMYELALDLGTSDTNIAWPDKGCSFTTRTKAVEPALDSLWDANERTPTMTLITASWLEEPDSILRRLATNGRTDCSFLIDVLRLANSFPGDVTDRANIREEAFWVFCCADEDAVDPDSDSENASVPQALSGSPRVDMSTSEGSYDYHRFPRNKRWRPSPFGNTWLPTISNIIDQVLQSYAQARAGSWKKTLHDNAEAVRDYGQRAYLHPRA